MGALNCYVRDRKAVGFGSGADRLRRGIRRFAVSVVHRGMGGPGRDIIMSEHGFTHLLHRGDLRGQPRDQGAGA